MTTTTITAPKKPSYFVTAASVLSLGISITDLAKQYHRFSATCHSIWHKALLQFAANMWRRKIYPVCKRNDLMYHFTQRVYAGGDFDFFCGKIVCGVEQLLLCVSMWGLFPVVGLHYFLNSPVISLISFATFTLLTAFSLRLKFNFLSSPRSNRGKAIPINEGEERGEPGTGRMRMYE